MMQSGGTQGLNLGSLLSAKRMIKGAASSLPGSLVTLFDFSKSGQSHGPGHFSSLVQMLRGKPSNSGQTVIPLKGRIGQSANLMSNLVARPAQTAGHLEKLAKRQSIPDSNADILLPDASKVTPDKATAMTAAVIKGQQVTVTSKHHANSPAATSKRTVTGQVINAIEIAVNGTEASPVTASNNAGVEQNTPVPATAKLAVNGTEAAPVKATDIAGVTQNTPVLTTAKIAVKGTDALPVKASNNAGVEQNTSAPATAEGGGNTTPEPVQGISKILNVAGKQVGNSAKPLAVKAATGNMPEAKAPVAGPDGLQLKTVEPGKQATPGKIEPSRDVVMSGERLKVVTADNNVIPAKVEVGTVTENLEPHQRTTNQVIPGNQGQQGEPVHIQSKVESQAVKISSKGIRLADGQPAIKVADTQPESKVVGKQPAIVVADKQPAIKVADTQPAIKVVDKQPAIVVADKQPAINVDSEGRLVHPKTSPPVGKTADHQDPIGQNANNRIKNRSVGENIAPKVQVKPFGQGKIAVKMAKMMAGEQTPPALAAGPIKSTPQTAVDQAGKSGDVSGRQAPKIVVPSATQSTGQKVIGQPTGSKAISNAVQKNERISVAGADRTVVSRANHSLEPAAPAAPGGITRPEPAPAIRIMPELNGPTPQVALKTPESRVATQIKDSSGAVIPKRSSASNLASEGVKSTGAVKSDHIQSEQIGVPHKAVDQIKVTDVLNSAAKLVNGANSVVNAANSGIVTGLRETDSKLVAPQGSQDTAKKRSRKQTSSINQTPAVKAKVNVHSRNKAVYSVARSNDKTASYSTIALNGSSKQTAGDSVTGNNGQAPRVADRGPESTVITDSFKVDTSNGISQPVAQQLGISETSLPTLSSRPGLSDLPTGIADLTRFAIWQHGRVVRGNNSSEGFDFNAGSLGNIKIKFSEDEAGTHMRIVVNSEEVQRLVQDSLPRVEQEFTFQGMKFAGINVEVGNAGTGKASHSEIKPQPNLTGKPEEYEVSTAKDNVLMKDYGYNSVEYVA